MSSQHPPRPLVPASALPERLISGYRAFVDERLPREKSRLETLATQGQRPEIMIIGCCDSRVAPEVIFDARPGELFVVRNVANLVPPYAPDEGLHGVSAALEFAVQALRVKHIVVMGHGRCGGIRAFASHDREPLSPSDFIGQWIRLVGPAAAGEGQRRAEESLEDYVERLALISIENSIANLLTFPYVRTLHERGELQLHGAYFDVFSGVLLMRDPNSGRFVPAVEGITERISVMGCQ